MARLPGVFDTSAPRSETPSTATVSYEGLANSLENIGQAIDKHDAHLDEEAEKSAETHYLQAMADYAPARAKREAEYTGEDDSFPGQEIAAYDQTVQAYRDAPDLDPRVKRALIKKLDQGRVQASSTAISFNAAKQGQLESLRRAAVESASDTNVMVDLAPRIAEAAKQVFDSWDGKSAGYATGVKAAYDGVVDGVLKDMDEAQKLRLLPALQAQGNQYFAQAMAAESKGQESFVLNSANAASDVATNMVIGDPEQYQVAGMLIDKAADALPGPAQEAWRKGAREQLLMTRLGGLIQQGKGDQAAAELAGADATLQPENKARVQAMLSREAEKKTVLDYTAQADVQARIAAYYDGNGPAPSDSEIEGAVGPAGLADFRRKDQLVKDAKARVGDFGYLPVPAMDARIEEQRKLVTAGGAHYDINAAVLSQMEKAKAAQVKARTADPAAWAMAGDGSTNDPARLVQQAWMAVGQAAPGPARVQAAKRYVDMTLDLQRRAGIANPSILRADDAKAMLNPLKDAKDELARGDALMGVMSNVGAFGDNRGQVLAELGRAGLGSQDALVVAEWSDNPIKARDYVNGGPHWKALKPKEQHALTDRVASQMRKFDATITGGPATPSARNDRYEVIARTAAGYMATGDGQDHAVKRAADEYGDRYTFVGTWRMPAQLAGKSYELYGRKETGLKMATYGAYSVVSHDLTRMGGAVLSDKPAEAQAKLNLIKRQGKWYTADDDSGLQLMVPDPVTGRPQVVRDKTGRPMAFTWDDLAAKAQNPYGDR